MKRRAIVIIGLATGMVLGANVHALPSGASGTPYQSIVERNPFGLKPPPPVADPSNNVPPPPKIALLGTANMSGKKVAILKLMDPPKPGQPAQQDPFVLSEGEAQQDIEVKEINEKDGAVKIINHGKAMTLTFKDDGAKPPAGAAQAGPVPGLGLPSLPAPRPIAQAASFAPPAAALPTAPSPPPVTTEVGGGSTAATTPSVSAAGQVALLGGGQSMIPRPIRMPEPPSATEEEQIIGIEVQREAYKQANDDTARILPITELTPPEDEPPPTTSPHH